MNEIPENSAVKEVAMILELYIIKWRMGRYC